MKKTWKRLAGLIMAALIVLFFLGYKSDISPEVLKSKYTNAASQFLTMDGMEVHYRIEGSGHPLVLLHGTAASLHTWDDWVTNLSDSFQIIRLDLPAFGLTGPNSERDYSIDYYTGFLQRFFAKIQLDSFHLAGNSLGGRIAWNYAHSYPDQVRKLVLLDASGAPNQRGVAAVFKLARNPFSAFLLRNILPRSFIVKNMKEVYFDHSKITATIVDRYHELALREGNRQAFIDRANMHYKDQSHKLQELNCPTFIIWGLHDQWVAVEDADFFDKRIPNSTLKIYANAGHIPMEEIPTETAIDTKRFLFSD